MFRLLHLADVHLDAPLGGFGEEADVRRGQVLDAFRAVSDIAIEASVDAVLISGDLFDGPQPGERTVIAVRETVRRLLERGVDVAAVPGNHDARALNPGLYAEALDGAHVFLEPRFGEPARFEREAGELLVYGVGYDAAEEPDPIGTFERGRSRASAAAHVVLLHGSVPGAPHWASGSSLSLAWEGLAGLDVDYIALGDLHRFRAQDELEGLPACYPGSFAAVDMTEAGPRGPVLVRLEPGSTLRLERISSGVREVGAPIAINVSDCVTDLEVYEAAVRVLSPETYPSIDLEGEPAYPLDPEVIRSMLEERFGAVSLRDRSRFFEVGRLAELSAESTIAGHVARIGLRRIEEADSPEERAAREQGLRIALRVMEV
ncbi:MAG: DNA repair exonuclease [Gemmatimonadota bacterium]|nr:DNA repair exonuclease [Gemmatimonadota bacterium]